MRHTKAGLVTAALGCLLLAGTARADLDSLSFRILGWYQGVGDISSDQIKCEVPTVETAFPDSNFAMGLWNTYGRDTLFFPDDANPFANPCGGWLQFQNFLSFEGITVERIAFKMTIPGARQYRTLVPTSKAFPTACRGLRRVAQFVGNRLDPATSTTPHSNSGEPNVAFIKMRPMIRTDLIHCLRAQYAPLSTADLTQIPLVVFATAYGVTDSGKRYKSNTVTYTLNLRHTCGNGRVDDGEECDPGLATDCRLDKCLFSRCERRPSVACVTDADCPILTCRNAGDPSECSCL